MTQGLVTSLLIKLTLDYWYFTLIAMLIKLFFIRLTVAENFLRAFLMWLVGSIAFFTIACITGLIFGTLQYKFTAFLMFAIAFGGELLFLSVMFRTEMRKLVPSMVIGNGLYITILYMGALSSGFI